MWVREKEVVARARTMKIASGISPLVDSPTSVCDMGASARGPRRDTGKGEAEGVESLSPRGTHTRWVGGGCFFLPLALDSLA